MKTRILSAAVLVPLLVLLILVAKPIYAAVTLAVLLAIAVYELLYRTEFIRYPRLVIYSAAIAFGIALWSCYGAPRGVFLLMLLIFTILLFGELMQNHVKIRLELLGLCYFAGVIVPYLLSSLIRILVMMNGRYLICIPFLIAFLNDGGAYFIGIRFGRHKLAPVVSPNKTVEGLLGGILTTVLGMLLYGVILALPLKMNVNFWLVLLYGLAGSAVGAFGDLCFSAIKRESGLKDYGNLIPGHGGALDRLDSLVTVAPLVEALVLLLPLFK